MTINFNAIQDIFQPNLSPVAKGQDRWFCPGCRKSLNQRMFFKSGRIEKYPNGLLTECKNCVTLTIDDSEPATFLALLKEIDVPYIPSEWRSLLSKKDARAGSIVGKYVSKMKLNQYKRYSWLDSENLVKEEEEALISALENENLSRTDAEQRMTELTSLDDVAPTPSIGSVASQDRNIAMLYGLTPETSKYGLTGEKILELQATWGSDYSEDEYYQMEELNISMRNAYILNDPIAISNAKMISKMTMKMNKFLDIDDVESASKISRQLDLFIKTSNLAPQQQKDRGNLTYSIGELAFLLEKEGGFVPQYYVDADQDNLDALLSELQKFTERLIYGEAHIQEIVESHEDLLGKYAIPENAATEDAFVELEREMMGDGSDDDSNDNAENEDGNDE